MQSFSVKVEPNTWALQFPTAANFKTANSIAGTGVSGFNSLTTEGAPLASASTVNLDAATGYFTHITGTTTITALTLAQGNMRVLIFDGALTLTNNASILNPTSANITTAAGDMAWVIGEGSSVTRVVSYQRKTGAALVGANPFNQSLNTSDTPTFAALSIGSIEINQVTGEIALVSAYNGLNIVNNGGNTLDIGAGFSLITTQTYTFASTTGQVDFVMESSTAPSTVAIGVPTITFGNPAAGLLGAPDIWAAIVIDGTQYRVALYQI